VRVGSADLRDESIQGRQYPGEVILQAVRWYLRYPLVYEHVAELLAERGIEVDAKVGIHGLEFRPAAKSTKGVKGVLKLGQKAAEN
jgi:hypothetical protein